MRIIGYERVCTARQGASGLGIEAQRQAIDGLRHPEGRTAHRPLHRGRERAQPRPAGAEAGAAPRQGHRGDAGDRQARPAVAQCRLPADAAGQRGAVRRRRPAEANDLTVGIMALVAAGARGDLQAHQGGAGVARSRGVKLGNPNGAAALRRAGKAVRRSGRPSRATPTGTPGPRAGGRGHPRRRGDEPPGDRGELNARGMLTRRGGRWHVSTVTNLLDRLGLMQPACAHEPG